jgi:hypothetical protein
LGPLPAKAEIASMRRKDAESHEMPDGQRNRPGVCPALRVLAGSASRAKGPGPSAALR